MDQTISSFNRPGVHATLIDRFFGRMLREAWLDMARQSYPPDPWEGSSLEWKRVIDDFWSISVRPPLKDPSRLSGESYLSAEQAGKLKEDLSSLTSRVDNLYWKPMPWSKGVCGRQKRRGSICAVHRWNAYARNDRLVGRFQCWTDVSLMQHDPGFVRWHPFFHPAFLQGNNDFFCLLDIPGYVGSFGAPESRPVLQINDLMWYCSGSVDNHIQVREGDLPVNIFQRELQPYFLPMLDSFIADEEDSADDDDEGEIIDLDLEDFQQESNNIADEL